MDPHSTDHQMDEVTCPAPGRLTVGRLHRCQCFACGQFLPLHLTRRRAGTQEVGGTRERMVDDGLPGGGGAGAGGGGGDGDDANDQCALM